MDLVRKILIDVEAKDDGRAKVYEFKSETVELRHHVNLLIKAELLEQVSVISSADRKKVHLTWDGHDFLDAIKDQNIWNQTKTKLTDVGGAASLEVVKAVAVSIMTSALGLAG